MSWFNTFVYTVEPAVTLGARRDIEKLEKNKTELTFCVEPLVSTAGGSVLQVMSVHSYLVHTWHYCPLSHVSVFYGTTLLLLYETK
jgi:hypothetical protein